MNVIKRFLINCAGANASIIAKTPTEVAKYMTVGITIIFTGLFASLSGGYAFYKVFNKEINTYEVTIKDNTETGYIYTQQFEKRIPDNINGVIVDKKIVNTENTFVIGAIILGLLWGFMIFNLDRFIVMSIKKKKKFWTEFKMAFPRVLLAIIISLVVAKPLEVRLFQDRIAAQISDNELEKREGDKVRIDNITDKSRIDSIRNISLSEVATIKAQLASDCNTPECAKAYEVQQSEYEKYLTTKKGVQPLINSSSRDINFIKNTDTYKNVTILDGIEVKELTEEGRRKLKGARKVFDTNISSRNAAEEKYNTKLNKYNEAVATYKKVKRDELNDAKQKDQTHSANQASANALKVELDNKTDEATNTAFTNNFITQIEALNDLTTWNKDGSSNIMWYMNLFIILLFIVIETAPIFVKLISSKGQYDVALEAEETKNEARLIQEANTEIAVNEHQSQLRLQNLQNNQEAQLITLQFAIQKWQQKKQVEINTKISTEEEFKSVIEDILNFNVEENKTIASNPNGRTAWNNFF